MRDWIVRLEALGFGPNRISLDAPMSRHTTMRVGGPADLLIEPETPDQVCAAVALAKREGIPMLIVGNGSNLIVRDGGIRGLVIKLADAFSSIERQGNALTAQAGAKLSAVAMTAQKAGLTGLEFAAGIPGTVGGGVAMNAGAYGGELKDVLTAAEVLAFARVETFSNADFGFGYRVSRAQADDVTVLSATFQLSPGDPAEIQARMAELAARRRDKQPLTQPSAGSTFKRPEGHFAGALIEQAGLKGRAIGGAQVSEKHAGFVVNTGGATARDVLELIELIIDTVHARTGVTLKPEVRIVGED